MKTKFLFFCSSIFLAALSQAGTYSYVGSSATHAGGIWPSGNYRRTNVGWTTGTNSNFSLRETSYYLSVDYFVQNPGQDIPSGTPFISYLDRDNITIKYQIQWNGTDPTDTPPATDGYVETYHAEDQAVQSGPTGNGSCTSVAGRRFDPLIAGTYLWTGLNQTIVPSTPPTITHYPGGAAYAYYRPVLVSFSWTQTGPSTWLGEATVPFDSLTIEFDLQDAFFADRIVYCQTYGEWLYKLVSVNGSPI